MIIHATHPYMVPPCIYLQEERTQGQEERDAQMVEKWHLVLPICLVLILSWFPMISSSQRLSTPVK